MLCEKQGPLGFEFPAVPENFVPLAILTAGKIRLTAPACLTTACVAKNICLLCLGHNTLHLVFNGVDYVLQIRSVGSSNIRHDVILRDVEFIMNEDLATLVDIKAAESNNLDLGKIYKDAQDLSRK